MDLPRKRSDAISLGIAKYFTGEACINGHVSKRYTVLGTCVECAKMHTKRNMEKQRRKYQEAVRARQLSASI